MPRKSLNPSQTTSPYALLRICAEGGQRMIVPTATLARRRRLVFFCCVEYLWIHKRKWQ